VRGRGSGENGDQSPDEQGNGYHDDGTLVQIAVEALALRSRTLARREALVAALAAACVSSFLAVYGPPAGDEPAHFYRTFLVEEGAFVWDNLWYAGHYPLASYSLLYYLPAAIVGNLVLAVGAAVTSAALFALLCVREWGEAACWPARAFAVFACAPLFTGTYAWALGLAFALGALAALQGGRTWLALACTALALGFSPLAFVFLCLALVAVLVVKKPAPRTALVVGSGLAVLAGAQLAIAVLFAAEARYAFRASELGLGLAVAVTGAVVVWRSPHGRLLAVLFLLFGLVCLVAFVIPSPFGSNLTRFRSLSFPLMLLAAALAGFRPRLLAIPALAAALAYTVSTYAAVATGLTDTRAAHVRFWTPALDFLRRSSEPGYRVDVVPTFDNWEAYFLPREGFALARGWYRQLDLARNAVLYEQELIGAEYRAWLRSLGVRYVLLPDVPLDRVAAESQAELLRSGRSGLTEVHRTENWRIFELPDATPILTGPGRAGLTALEHERIAGFAGASGSYLLRVRYTPYLAVERGDLCLEKAPDGMTRLEIRRPGPFVLAVPETGAFLKAVLGERRHACP
jgi:hypothetical protein